MPSKSTRTAQSIFRSSPIIFLWLIILVLSLITLISQHVILHLEFHSNNQDPSQSKNEGRHIFFHNSDNKQSEKDQSITSTNTSESEESSNNNTTIAYVVSLIKCPKSSHTTGFLDATLILRHSIHRQHEQSPYNYKMIAIIHKRCEAFGPLFESIGIETLVKDSPVLKSQILNDDYRNHVDKELCCGSSEFIKLYAYSLVQYKIIVMMDMDMILLQPLDHLFNSMLYPPHSSIGKHARDKLELEHSHLKLPKNIEAFFTRDYTSSRPWKIIAAVQAGFVMLRPNLDAMHEYFEIIRIGNYTIGYNNESGWDGLGYGGWLGGMAMQGILPYFYDHRHPNIAVELNVCRHNQVAASVLWNRKTPKKELYYHKCNKYPSTSENPHLNTNCEDCRHTPIDLVKSVHYTACKKPWTCPMKRQPQDTGYTARKRLDPEQVNVSMCFELQKKWFETRLHFENALIKFLSTKNKLQFISNIQQRNGTFLTEYYLGYCSNEATYLPLHLPQDTKGIVDLSLLYDNIDNS